MAKVSPVEASSSYLGHLRDAWNAAHPDHRLEDQEVLLTVPASFDASARALTVEAAGMAGLDNVTLLEEPQSAFYAWLSNLGDAWRKRVKVGDLALVCDVGGGTTDFSLIEVAERDGELELNRLAVGEHILLGGDNMDLALAYAVAETLPGGMENLDPSQRVALIYACRNGKETLLSDPKAKSATISVLGRGSKVIGGAVKAELTRAMVDDVLINGFFPACSASDLPVRGRRIGLTEIGLPYASDPAITKHLARFLSRQGESLPRGGSIARPSAVLFNGGVFRAGALRDRVASTLESWGGGPVSILEATDLDLAVARGAAYYGLVRRGRGIRIRGGAPSVVLRRHRDRRPGGPPGSPRRSRPSASCRWGWKRGPPPTSPKLASAWSSARTPSSDSSAPPSAATTPLAPSSTAGPRGTPGTRPPRHPPRRRARRGGGRGPREPPERRHRGRHAGTLVRTTARRRADGSWNSMSGTIRMNDPERRRFTLADVMGVVAAVGLMLSTGRLARWSLTEGDPSAYVFTDSLRCLHWTLALICPSLVLLPILLSRTARPTAAPVGIARPRGPHCRPDPGAGPRRWLGGG